MTARRPFSALIAILLLPVQFAVAEDPVIAWPAGWQVEALPETPERQALASTQVRQRAVKNDQAGNPSLVMELTQTTLTPGHEVNVKGVLLEMRKAVQVSFARSGLQSACTPVRDATLGTIPALETTCSITQNGTHVLTQTLVAAASRSKAWSLSYAGSAEGYAAGKAEMLQIRNGLNLESGPQVPEWK